MVGLVGRCEMVLALRWSSVREGRLKMEGGMETNLLPQAMRISRLGNAIC